jgi:hypothetical protein
MQIYANPTIPYPIKSLVHGNKNIKLPSFSDKISWKSHEITICRGEKISLPSGKRLQFAIEHCHRKFGDLPSYKMLIIHSYVNVYQSVHLSVIITIIYTQIVSY